MSDKDDDAAYTRKWEWWRVSSGEWKRADQDWLTGSLQEMVMEYGGCHDRPMLEHNCDDPLITVFSLDYKRITPEEFDQLSEYKIASDEEKDRIHDKWDEDSGVSWLWYFEDVYPSSHLVFAHYGDLVEAHGIFCETFKDMLEVVRLLRSDA